jgi:hypothetical protein
VSDESTKEVTMSAMVMVLRKLHVMPRSVSGNARVRIHLPTRTEQPAAKVRQWNDLIPGSEVRCIRYIAELDGGSACQLRVILS